jgi:hypothetical protein
MILINVAGLSDRVVARGSAAARPISRWQPCRQRLTKDLNNVQRVDIGHDIPDLLIAEHRS